MWVRLILVLGYVQKTCILALVRKSSNVCLMLLIDVVLQGTLAKAWILWNSRRPRVTFKILCKLTILFIENDEFGVHHWIFYDSAEYQQVVSHRHVSLQCADLVLCVSIVPRSHERGGGRRCGIRGSGSLHDR